MAAKLTELIMCLQAYHRVLVDRDKVYDPKKLEAALVACSSILDVCLNPE